MNREIRERREMFNTHFALSFIFVFFAFYVFIVVVLVIILILHIWVRYGTLETAFS